MTQSSLAESADRLSEALDGFDWEAAEKICGGVIERLGVSTFAEAGIDAHRMLNDLRRKRRFALLERLADALIVAGFRSTQIRCEYAQALIDQRRFAAAEYVLASFGHDGGLSEAERAEITGLVGRLWKQLYVNPGDRAKASEPAFLNRAIAAYAQEYERKPGERTWHGINAVALIARAERDGLPTDPSYPSWRTLASDILRSLDARSRAGGGPPPAFDVATRVEAFVAIERWTDAEAAAAEYVRCPDADAFELGSTDRQLREVWGVTSASPGAQVLSIIDAVLLRKQGGGVAFSGVRAEGEQQAVDAARSNPALEAVLGAERFQTLTWYRQGLECCSSIARIETRSGRGFGTGWLVGGGELNPAWASETLLITNKHVISPSVNGRPFVPAPSLEALRPEDAIVFLQVHGVRVEVDSVAWTSPDLELDATIVRLRNLPASVRPLPLASSPVLMRQPPARVYVIGHPAGRDLEFSLHDNQMLDCDERRLHYRAPTEGGSSGSPVFDEEGWRVVALHHAGGRGIPRLDRPGEAYDANEGITIDAIRQGCR